MLLGVERTDVRTGLFGFNGALVAIALLYFLSQVHWVFWLCCAGCSVHNGDDVALRTFFREVVIS